jgi:hypothetical protein
MKQNDYVPTQSTNLQIRVYKQLFVFVVDSKAHGMVTSDFSFLLLQSLALNLPSRPKMDKPKTWKMQAWVHEDYEEFYVEQLNYHELKIGRQSFDKTIISEALCDAKTFYQKIVIAAEYFLNLAENNHELLPKNDSILHLKELKKNIAFIKLFRDNYYF